MRNLRKPISCVFLLIFGSLAAWLYWPADWSVRTIERLGGSVQRMTLPECEGRFAIALPDTVTDDDLEHLSALDRLDPACLQLRGPQLTGRGLTSLTRLQGLHILVLYGTSITDDDVETLQAFPELATLNLDGSRLGAPGLEHLKKLPALRCVSLRSTSLPAEAVLRFQADREKVIVLSEFTDKEDD
jgi:hypothetical protein